MRKILWLTTILATAIASWCYQAQTEPDSDGDGLTDYQEAHKYFTDPRQSHTAGSAKLDSDAEQRKEFTYTVTSVVQLAKPFRIADMTDDYQDARLISQDEESATVEIVYYPLNTNRDAIGENANWRRDYAHMTQYLAPTATENWDAQMRADLLAELRENGIEPDVLADKELVTQAARWLKRRSKFINAFAIWYVHYPDGKPEVFPLLRRYFDREKSAPDMTDTAMFDQEVLGRSMFYKRVHGSCTSYAVYCATAMRALGIPTRIVFCIPPVDSNDREQKEMLLSNIHHNGVRATVRHGLPRGGFSNHLFNEVFIGNRWVRLNYDVLGQNTLDEEYYGLLTHILTTDSLSYVPLPETWGRRYATYPAASPRLSSSNPYQLLRVADHFGVHAKIANPAVADEELRTVTVKDVYWKDALPAYVTASMKSGDPTKADFYIGIQEYIPRYAAQMRDFEARAGHRFVLAAPGHPNLKATLSGMKLSNGSQYQMFGVRIDAESRQDLALGVDYTIRPINTSEVYRWTIKQGLVLHSPKSAQ